MEDRIEGENALASFSHEHSMKDFQADDSTGSSISDSFSGRARALRIIGSIVVLVACLGVTFGTASNSRNPVHEARRVCKDLEVAELKGAHLEVSMEGLSRLATEEEQAAIEIAVLNAYNDVSARCGDVYERWMYETNMVKQTVQDTKDGASVVIAEIELTISCADCPDEDVFASEYAASARSQLLSSTALARKYDHVRGSSASSRRFLQKSTINARDVVYKIDENLQKASQNNTIESTYSRLTIVFIENRKSGVKRKVETNAKHKKAYGASSFQEHDDQISLDGVGQRASKRFTLVEADESSPQPRLKGGKYEMQDTLSAFLTLKSPPRQLRNIFLLNDSVAVVSTTGVECGSASSGEVSERRKLTAVGHKQREKKKRRRRASLSSAPSCGPQISVSMMPSTQSSTQPSSMPSTKLSSKPSSLPSLKPSLQASSTPSSTPNDALSSTPSSVPSSSQSSLPSLQPSLEASSTPSSTLSEALSSVPSSVPSSSPSSEPSMMPSEVPSSEPSSNPSDAPSSLPSIRPSSDAIVYGLQSDCYSDDVNKFNICLDLSSTSGDFETWMQSFGDARDRWEQVIVEDNGGFFNPKDVKAFKPSVEFATEVPDIVDDIYIGAILAPIDGKGNVLGSAGPTYVNYNPAFAISDRYRVLTGFMTFDEEDVEMLMATGLWTGVILHEMGHVLGIGSKWEVDALNNYGEDEYLGSLAKAEWAKLGCSGKLPVELDIPNGAFGHWDEECLDHELMTGIIDHDMRLSVITVASLHEMGYGVDYLAADPYDISMLADCGAYCPEAPSQARPAETKKPISAEGRASAVKRAYQELSQARDQHISETMGGDSIFVGGNFTNILYQDSDDGDIYSVSVSWAEALKYMEDSGEV